MFSHITGLALILGFVDSIRRKILNFHKMHSYVYQTLCFCVCVCVCACVHQKKRSQREATPFLSFFLGLDFRLIK